MDRAKFNKYWRNTKIIREYQPSLFTFGSMDLPYILACEHSRKDRTIVIRGVVVTEKPIIKLPAYMYEDGPHFANGFKDMIRGEVSSFLRFFRIPYCHIHNRVFQDQKIEYGNLNSVLDRYNTELENARDTETGLIKGSIEGAEISLGRYLFQLTAKSRPENVREFMEHIRRRRGEPIRPDDKITDEEIARLFE